MRASSSTTRDSGCNCLTISTAGSGNSQRADFSRVAASCDSLGTKPPYPHSSRRSMQRAHLGQVREHRTLRARQGAHDFSALAGAGGGDGTAAG